MKTSQRTTPTQATAALAVGLIAMPAAMAASHPAASHPKPPPTASAARASRTPGLTISISDGHVAARAGDKLTYTVSVRNSGTVAVRRLKVTQTLSPGLEFLSASDHGVAASGHVSWTASLPVGGKRTFLAVTRVTRTPTTLLRLAAVACVTLPGSSRPIVCAAHLDRLPAARRRAGIPIRSLHRERADVHRRRSGRRSHSACSPSSSPAAGAVCGGQPAGDRPDRPACGDSATARLNRQAGRPRRSGRSLAAPVLPRVPPHGDHEGEDQAAQR